MVNYFNLTLSRKYFIRFSILNESFAYRVILDVGPCFFTNLKKKNKNKSKLSKQLEQEQNHRNGDHMEGYQWGGGEERMREKGTRNKKHSW